MVMDKVDKFEIQNSDELAQRLKTVRKRFYEL